MTSSTVGAAPALAHRFADELPELAIAWQAEACPDPRLLVLDEELALELGLDPAWLRSPEGVGLLTGTVVPEGATPVAQVYAGHQFGGWTPRLGDGRALLLGELQGPDGALRDLHLKGSGRTPLARGGDGLAAVGPMLREHLVGVAMHALGVPTTRALSVTATGRPVRREVPLPGAVLARVAGSHLRVGTFQHAAATSPEGDLDLLRRLVAVATERHHPAAAADPQPALALLRAVVEAQARLVARWMLVGFVHGVMNTDNMTISGQTIDYGPCAFLEAFDPQTVFSSIDEGGRYAYGNQPPVAEWNLSRLAETLLPLIADDAGVDLDEAVRRATEAVGGFRTTYSAAWLEGMAAKLGLPFSAGVPDLVESLLPLLRAGRVDHTSFWRALAHAARGDAGAVRDLFLDRDALDEWLDGWRAMAPDGDAMDRVNPLYVPRNHLVEEALAAATAGDLAPYDALVAVVREPWVERPGLERYAEPAPVDFTAGYQTFCGT